MVEDTEVVTRDEQGEEVEVRLLAQVDPGENVRKEGSDVREGEKVLEKGDVVTQVGGELGTLAFVGKRSVSYLSPSRLEFRIDVCERVLGIGSRAQETDRSSPLDRERARRSTSSLDFGDVLLLGYCRLESTNVVVDPETLALRNDRLGDLYRFYGRDESCTQKGYGGSRYRDYYRRYEYGS
jgi:hypothetical protein